MSQAEALLATLAETVVEHDHPVSDTDTYFVINPDTREVTNESRGTNTIMQYDHDSERFTFELPRFVEGHDMLQCNRVIVHWNNIDSQTKIEVAESTELDDLRINPDDSSTVICSWLISRNSTQLAGNLSFLVQYKCVEDGNTTYEWHTDIYSDVEVKPGRNNGEQSVIEYTDIIEQWRVKLFGAGDTVIEEIAAASEAQKTSIESKGAETLATIPEDYSTTYNMANDALRTRANAIVVTAEGETVVAEDCSDDYLRGLHVYGKTTQTTTLGLQMLDLPDVESTTSSGVTWSCKNGVVRAYGKTTETSSTAGKIEYSILGKTGTFYISGSVEPIAVYCMVTKNGVSTWYRDTTFTLDGSETTALIYCQVYSEGVSVNATVYPMLNTGSVACPWEPYSGGVVSPSPEWPQELMSVENPTVGIYSANLANVLGIEVGANMSATVSSDGYTITCTGGADNPYTSSPIYLPMELLRGRTIILKADSITNSQDSGGKGGNVQLNIRDSLSMKYVAISPNNLKAVTTIPEDVSRVDLNIYTNNSATTFETENTTVVKGLRVSVVDTEWDSYKDEQTISLAHALSGIPVTTGGNYTDSNGQQWICDEIDFEHGVHIQRICEITIDGSQAVATDGAEHNPWRKYIWINDYPALAEYEGLCDKLRHRNSTELIAGNDVDDAGFSLSPHYNVIYFNIGHWMTEDTVEAATRALAEYPLTIKYALKNPIETPLTDEELFAFSQLHSNQLVTTALNTENAYMGLVYNADTKTYFTNSRASDEQVQTAVDAWLTKYFANAEGVSF